METDYREEMIPQLAEVYGGSKMQLILLLNARFQPKHRFELEDALQEIFRKNN